MINKNPKWRMVESGAYFKEAADEFKLNKSIISREMRKRKNRKAVVAIKKTRIKED
ncbi:hypothetical protein [Clostridium sp.]|uniref:hypothetical protein n=1 Tax=Clostridium sp. TaxID=1506 RepID=UPI003216A833